MIRKVLIVDDDEIWLRLIKKKFSSFADAFETVTAADGMEAVQKLKEQAISLVVTDLQMPHMDGLTLLAHLSEQYPDIPVIIMTAYSSPNSKKSVLDGGAAGYIEKPFVVEDLAEKINTTLEKESEGGTLQTVPLDMFIQLIEMEQKTCTIRVLNKSTGNKGVLFFNNGNLMEARYRSLQGTEAAYRIFSWDKVTLSIQDECAIKEKRIEGDLQAILFDAMRMKDELEASQPPEPDKDVPAGKRTKPSPTPQAAAKTTETEVADTPSARIQKRLTAAGSIKGIQGVSPDAQWDSFLTRAGAVGAFFDAGNLRAVFLGSGGVNDAILVPGEQTTILRVTSECARDRILDLLSE